MSLRITMAAWTWAAGILGLANSAVQAATLRVPSQYSTIQAAVNAAVNGDEVLVAISRWTVRLRETGWGDTVLPLPDGQWTDVLTDRQRKGGVSAAEMFDDLPVALLERADERLDA